MASASRALLRSKLPAAAAARFLRPLAATAGSLLPAAQRGPLPAAAPWGARRFATWARRFATSSLRDSSPNWNNRPPKETILLDGCDFEHWLVVVDPPPGNPANPDVPREEIIDAYIKTLAQVVGSDEEARMKIYSVSTKYYFAFGALVSEEVSLKLKELPNVRWVLPDSYLDVKNKDYGGEPFINGQPVAYDPKYHEEWVRNNARANERPRRNDRPRSFDPNRQRGGFDRRPAPPSYEAPPPPPPGQNQMPAHDAPPMRPAQGPPPNYQPHAPNQQSGYGPGGGPPNYPNAPPPPGYQGGPPSGYQAGNQGYQGNPGGQGPAYQSNNRGYQGGGGPGGNPSPPPFPGSNPPPPPYQGGGPSYGGGAPDYQGQGGNPGYQGSGNYNSAAPPSFEGRDGPGRQYQ